MANNYWIISNINGTVTNYYLSGGGAAQVTYAGTGTPWTAQTTTPYEIAMNDKTGPFWTPQAAQSDTVFSGGPPFRDGSSLLYRTYENVTETLPVQARGNTLNNRIFLKQRLERILKAGANNPSPILAIQPNGTTNPVYYNIVHADVQELPSALNEEVNSTLMRITVKLVCSPHGGRLTSGESALSAVTLGNTGASAPVNSVAYPALAGDLQYEGQPLNIAIVPSATTFRRFYLASIASVEANTQYASNRTTTSTSFDYIGDMSFSVLPFLNNPRLKPRILMNVSGSSNAQMQLVISLGGTQWYVSPWMGVTGVGMVDFGTFSLALRRSAAYVDGTGITNIASIRIRSTNGATASFTIGATEFLWYYTFCRADLDSGLAVLSTDLLYVDAFPEQANIACLPFDSTRLLYMNKSTGSSGPIDTIKSGGLIRGTPPRYYSGGYFYIIGLQYDTGTDTYTYTPSRTFVVTATHAPQWKTLRGAE